MRQSGFCLNLDNLAFGRTVLDVDEICRLDLDEGDAGEVCLRGELAVDNAERRIVIHGKLDVIGPAECDRCLEPFELAWVADVDAVVVRDPVDGETEDGKAWTVHQARGVVDLMPALKEAALLTLPLKMVCRENCLGICAHCGANRNKADCGCDQEITDPRWDALPS